MKSTEIKIENPFVVFSATVLEHDGKMTMENMFLELRNLQFCLGDKTTIVKPTPPKLTQDFDKLKMKLDVLNG